MGEMSESVVEARVLLGKEVLIKFRGSDEAVGMVDKGAFRRIQNAKMMTTQSLRRRKSG